MVSWILEIGGSYSLEASDFVLPFIMLLLIGAGVYVYQKRPYNNIVSMISPVLMIFFSFLILFLLAMGGNQNPGLIGATPFIGIATGVIALLASIADVIEELI